MNNNKIDCNHLETVLLQYEELLGNDNEDSPLWYWLFESAIKCNEYGMARRVIQKMPDQMRIEAMATLAIKSREEKYVEEVIKLVWEEIKARNNSGYLVLVKIIKSLAKTGEEKAIGRAIKEAEKIGDSVYRNSALNSVVKIVSEIKRRKANDLGRSVSEDSKIREKIFSLTANETKALVAASRA